MKALSRIIALVLLFGLAACSGGKVKEQPVTDLIGKPQPVECNLRGLKIDPIEIESVQFVAVTGIAIVPPVMLDEQTPTPVQPPTAVAAPWIALSAEDYTKLYTNLVDIDKQTSQLTATIEYLYNCIVAHNQEAARTNVPKVAVVGALGSKAKGSKSKKAPKNHWWNPFDNDRDKPAEKDKPAEPVTPTVSERIEAAVDCAPKRLWQFWRRKC